MRPRPIIPSCTAWPSLEGGCSERTDCSARSCGSRDGQRTGTVSAHILAASHLSSEFAITPDERIGRAVVIELGLGRARELGNDALGQRLAQFHAPLVEG